MKKKNTIKLCSEEVSSLLKCSVNLMAVTGAHI